MKSRNQILWEVKLWDENDVPGEWVSSRFEMGLLQDSDWSAEWISGNYVPEKDMRYPVDCFQKEFSAAKKMVLV